MPAKNADTDAGSSKPLAKGITEGRPLVQEWNATPGHQPAILASIPQMIAI
jgi:hypothetical protein